VSLNLLCEWGISKKIASQIVALVRHHMIPGGDFTKRTCVKLIRKLGAELSEKLFDLAFCDAKGNMGDGESIQRARGLFHEVQDNLRQTEEASGKRWPNGHDVMQILGIPSGPEVGRILEELDAAVGTGELCGKNEAVRWLRRLQGDFIRRSS
jgi:hypothetical protein